MLRLIPFLLLYVLPTIGASAQSVDALMEEGRYYVDLFSQKTYGAHAQNWGIDQAKNGLLYVANGNGVLEYDGNTWRLIELPGQQTALSLKIAQNGHIYVGGANEIGFLKADSTGSMRYHSLKPLIEEEDHRNFIDVRSIVETREGIYFQASNHLFRFQNNKLTGWHTEKGLFRVFSLENHPYVLVRDEGLMRIQNGKFISIQGGGYFADKLVQRIFKQSLSEYLVVTRRHGLISCKYSESSGFQCDTTRPELKEMLSQLLPYHAEKMRDGRIAIATLRGGVLLLDPSGRLFRQLNESSGISDNTTLFTFMDREGGLWLGHNNGISRVSIGATVTYFDKTTGITGSANDVMRYRGELYIATTFGVQRLERDTGGAFPEFRTTGSVLGQCWDFIATEDALLVGCADGVYNVLKDKKEVPVEMGSMYSTHRSTVDTTQFVLGLHNGVVIAQRVGASWQYTRLEEIPETVRAFVEDPSGTIWMGTENGVVVGLTLMSEGRRKIKRFDAADDLPAGLLEVSVIDNQPLVISKRGGGISKIVKTEKGYEVAPYEDFELQYQYSPRDVKVMAEDESGRVWLFADNTTGVALPRSDGPMQVRRVDHAITPAQVAYNMHADTEGVNWVVGPYGLLRFKINEAEERRPQPEVLIRRVATTNDSLLFAGHAHPSNASFTWDHTANDVSFTYAMPCFRAPGQTEYKTQLEGFDASWSDWSYENTKHYTNLPPGKYRFSVQARGIKGQYSPVNEFAFEILPPWYLSTWAYFFWIFLGGISINGIARGFHQIQSHKMIAQNRALEAVVAARTEEIKAQQIHLEEANKELKLINNELKLTNGKLEERTDSLRHALETNKEILGVTSHDLKNPLGGIIGMIDMILMECAEDPGAAYESVQENLPELKEEAEHMLDIVKRLLDKHRQDGFTKLTKEQTCFNDIVTTVLRWNDRQALSKNIKLHYHADANVYVDVDAMAIQRVLDNYVSNAIKYSPSGTNVWIKARTIKHATDQNDAQNLLVCVRDEGPGLTDRDKQKVFGKMQRLSARPTGGEHSTGLGLFVVKTLVEAHGGDVGVESFAGDGSTFWFTIPVHSAEEIAQSAN